MVDSPYLVKPGKKRPLRRIKPSASGLFKCKDDARPAIESNLQCLGELHQVLYAEARRSVLIVLQGMDTSGKDGTIEHVFGGVNPQGCVVVGFGVPSASELAHDYLWRIHHNTPPRGAITIFNRSHYESVLVERVHSIVPRGVWSKRYDHINEFERLLADEGTTIIKFFLHISKNEQKERLEARLKDPAKNWKFDRRDLDVRKLWDDYQEAYDDALSRCSTPWAPWYIVPADRKWFRNWVISDIIVRTLKKMKLRLPPPPEGIEKWKVV